jgi:tetraacyldisaccharide 4'-kinase
MLFIILAPFSWLYGAVMRFRNFLYDIGLKKSYSFDQAVISVGNLSVGGTGKTPMIEYLVRLLSSQYSIAILSRGYGRKTKGFRLAVESDDASTIGDEPFQFYQKFKDKVEVVVCENRVEGINQLMALKKSVQVILLDDAFQHRRVKPLYSVLLTDFSKPFFSDFILPQGRLRESRKGSERANVTIVTKCKLVTTETESDYKTKIQSYAGEKPVFFSAIGYSKPISLSDSQIGKEVVLVTGIANSKPLVDHITEKVSLRFHFDFGDHHSYTQKEVDEIQQKASSMNAYILTTEKDFVKLEKLVDRKLWFYLPIETQFLKNGSEFDKLVVEKIKSHLRD